MIANNRVNSRNDIIQALSSDKFKEKIGVTHISQSDNFIRLHFQDKKNVRLKGFVFTSQVTSKESLTQSCESIQSKEERLHELKSKLDKVIAKRAD
ncbi:hypothetical protein HKB02_01575, partial [Vibrio parahaemolyticus]|nr:hypothetical protein [Vibrio parahaemolyticus]